MTAAFGPHFAEQFPFVPIPCPCFIDRILGNIQPTEENGFPTCCIIHHADMITSCGRLYLFLRPGLAIPFPGLLAALTQINRTSTIQDEHIPVFVICRTTQDATWRSAFRHLLPLSPVPAPYDMWGFFAGICHTVDQEHLLQLGVIDKIRFPACRRIFNDRRGNNCRYVSGCKSCGSRGYWCRWRAACNYKNKTTSRAEKFSHNSLSSVFSHPHSYSISIFVFTPS